MGQGRRNLVLTLKLSDVNFERLLKRNPVDVHMESKEKGKAICVKELSHSTVWYSDTWQTPIVKNLESPLDFLHYYYMEQFEFHTGPIEQKKLFYNLYFLIPAKPKTLTKFLKWFREFMLKKKIPLEKADGFRAIFYSGDILSEEELKKLHCWKIKNSDNRYAVIYSVTQHKENVAHWQKLSQQEELKMKKEKELKAKRAQEDWDAETEEVLKKRNKKKKEKDVEEKRSKMKEKLTRGKDNGESDNKSAKKSRKVRESVNSVSEKKAGKKERGSKKAVKAEKAEAVNPIETASKSLLSYLKENLGEGVATISEKDVAKAYKTMPRGMMKKLAKAIEAKYNVQVSKDEDGVLLTVWKKSKKIAAKVFKAAA